ncbi:MAG: hypothetical protein HY513_04070 [Candidatus Aenigmarchaeota archaeon]|nr:hypothetical protein [Candidatus Aenigmarchaeota archaeon]
MVDITAALPLSMGGIIATFIDAIIAFAVIAIIDKFIGHNFEPKRTFAMAIIALFLAPIISISVLGSTTLPGFVSIYLVPLVLWMVLGELLLQGESMKTKLEVALIAFVVYSIMRIILAPAIAGLLGAI